MKFRGIILFLVFITSFTIKSVETQAKTINYRQIFQTVGLIGEYENHDVMESVIESAISEPEALVSTVMDKPMDIVTVSASRHTEEEPEKLTPERLSMIDLLARIIEAEAKGEPYDGKVAVGQVVMNRVEHAHFPDTIEEVIYQPRQFEPVMNGTFYNTATDSSIKAAEEALEGTGPVQSALYFYNPDIAAGQDWFNTLEYVSTIGNHVFRR